MRKTLLTVGIILASNLTFSNVVKAERLIDAARSESNGKVYQVDLDSRSEYLGEGGWRHVRFFLTTKDDPKKYPAIASCSPYQVMSEAYGWQWLAGIDGYPPGTVAGDIARIACDY